MSYPKAIFDVYTGARGRCETRSREGRGGRGGRGGREGGRGGKGGRRDDCYKYSNGPQYLNSNHVTYYVITCKSAFDWVYAEQWYVIIQIKLPELESKLVVNSRIMSTVTVTASYRQPTTALSKTSNGID